MTEDTPLLEFDAKDAAEAAPFLEDVVSRANTALSPKDAARLAIQGTLAMKHYAPDAVIDGGPEADQVFNSIVGRDYGGEDFRAQVGNSKVGAQNKQFEDMLFRAIDGGDTPTATAMVEALKTPPKVDKFALEKGAVNQLQNDGLKDDTQTEVTALSPPEQDDAVNEFHAKQAILQNMLAKYSDRFEDATLAEKVLSWAAFMVPLNVVESEVDILKGGQKVLTGQSISEQKRTLWALPMDQFEASIETWMDEMEKSGVVSGKNDLLNMIAVTNMLEFDPTYENQHTALSFLEASGLAGIGKVAKAQNLVKLYNAMKNPLQFMKGLNRTGAAEEALKAMYVSKSKATDAQVLRSSSAMEAAIRADNVTDIVLPSTVSRNPDPGVGMAGDVMLMDDIQKQAIADVTSNLGVSRMSPEEAQAAFEAAKKDVTDIFRNSHIADVKNLGEDPKTGLWNMEISLGKAKGTGGYATEQAATQGAAKRGLQGYGVKVEQDTSGQWFVKVKQPIPEKGWLSPIDESAIGTSSTIVANVLNPLSWLPKVFAEKSLVSAFKSDRVNKTVVTLFNKNIRTLSATEDQALQQVLRYGETASESGKGKWFDYDELTDVYLRQHGRYPSKKERIAYNSFKNLNDLDYELLNTAEYVKHARLGYQQVQNSKLGINQKGKLMSRLPEDSATSIFNVSGNEYFVRHGNEMSDARLMELIEKEGYRIVMLKEPVLIGQNDFPIKVLIGKPKDLQMGALDPIQVPYMPGGHRGYKGKLFAKQARIEEKSFNGKTYNIKHDPVTHSVFESRKDALKYQKDFEEARKAVLDYKKLPEGSDPTSVNEALRKISIQNIEEWNTLAKEGAVVENYPLEILDDRVSPSAYTEALGDLLDVSNPAEIMGSEATWLMQRNKGYLGRKGDRMVLPDGTQAPVLSPFEMQQKAVRHAIEMGTWGSYKVEAIERWVEGAKRAGIIDPQLLTVGRDPYMIFDKAAYVDNRSEVAQKFEATRVALRRMLGQKTRLDHEIETKHRGLADMVEKMTGGKVTYTQSLEVSQKNWLGASKGLVFDAYLGLASPGQLFVQATSAVGLAAMKKNPAYLGKGLALQWGRLVHPDNVDKIAAMAKVHGMQPAEFKAMLKAFNDSGFGDVEYTSAMLEGATPGLSSIEEGMNAAQPGVLKNLGKEFGKGFNNIRRGGRYFFYAANRFNRSTAFSIAWDEFRTNFPNIDPSSTAGMGKIMDRASALDMDMNKATATALQKGVLGNMTQFNQYSQNLLTNVIGDLPGMGGKSRWSKEDRRRYAIGQMVMWGSASVPAGQATMNAILEHYEDKTGIKVPQTVRKGLQTGVVDAAVYALTDGEMDTAFGARVGPGTGWQRYYGDVMTEKPLMETIAGPSGEFGHRLVDTVIKDVAFLTNSAVSGELNPSRTFSALMDLAKLTKTGSDIATAKLIYEKGILLSRTGKVQDHVSKLQALAQMLGLPSGTVNDASIMYKRVTDQKEHIKGLADLITKNMRTALINSEDQGLAAEMNARNEALYAFEDPNVKYEVQKMVAKNLQQSTMYQSMTESDIKMNGETPINRALGERMENKYEEQQ